MQNSKTQSLQISEEGKIEINQLYIKAIILTYNYVNNYIFVTEENRHKNLGKPLIPKKSIGKVKPVNK